ncbi:MAG: TraR/DksA C4-type zinc finger protein [Ignavibacteria bacterium]|nr:TraR/DksA C4-type zinc finger protein [Ignavibacteria bacterium]
MAKTKLKTKRKIEKKTRASSKSKPVKKKTIQAKKKSSAIRLGKTYLTQKDLNHFKKLLLEQKNEILENARKLRESLIDTSGDYVGDNQTFSVHMAEQGTDEMEREKLYLFIQRDEKHLYYIESALERIAKKTYGLCVSCGKPINKARLEAVPITSHCINCKESLSH